ncbi:antibiotic biosynthesis monooxygenase family protein [Singulisphaera sp. PoT]|uniref:antibiotic biosynthesis monooxygenase family protein n=1 Tax=Singulisphaera sp. PoT TaxID=3411797 RepID=UPI003BF5558C
MLTVGMYYDVLPDKVDLFTTKFQDVLRLLETIPGHSTSFLYQRVDDPLSYAILSEWSDEKAFRDFIRSAAFHQVTSWGKEQVLRSAPRHKVYPRTEDVGRPS